METETTTTDRLPSWASDLGDLAYCWFLDMAMDRARVAALATGVRQRVRVVTPSESTDWARFHVSAVA